MNIYKNINCRIILFSLLFIINIPIIWFSGSYFIFSDFKIMRYLSSFAIIVYSIIQLITCIVYKTQKSNNIYILNVITSVSCIISMIPIGIFLFVGSGTYMYNQYHDDYTFDWFSSYQDENIDISEIPDYTHQKYVEINNNIPYFDEADLSDESFERYSELDELGRCGVAYANIGVDLMPTEKRGSIGMIKPSGWHTVKYNNVDGKYLYNRCHLIAYQLSGENANEKNLITGTRYMNVEGMLPFEERVGNYVRKTENHVLYRVTPFFEGDNLLAKGVLMEAMSVEDSGEDICFCVFVYNVQPDIQIDYATGKSQYVKE